MNFGIKSLIVLVTACFFHFNSVAQTIDPLADLFADEPEFLKVDQAFQFDFVQQDGQLRLKWIIADG